MTRLVMAFARHNDMNNHGGNMNFFRDILAPELEDIAKKGKRALVLFEISFYPQAFGQFPPTVGTMWNVVRQEGAGRARTLAKLQRKLEKHKIVFDREMESTFEIGKRSDKYELDWGFEDTVARINGKNPGQMRIISEPQSAEAIHALFRADLMEHMIQEIGGYPHIDAVVDHVEYYSEHLKLRDTATFSAVEQLAAEDPEGVIILPRGTAHRNMASLYGNNKYEVTCMELKREQVRLVDDLASELHYTNMTREDLRLHIQGLIQQSCSHH